MTKEKQIAELTHYIFKNIVVDFYTSHAGPGIARGGEIMKDVEALRLLMINEQNPERSVARNDATLMDDDKQNSDNQIKE